MNCSWWPGGVEEIGSHDANPCEGSTLTITQHRAEGGLGEAIEWKMRLNITHRADRPNRIERIRSEARCSNGKLDERLTKVWWLALSKGEGLREESWQGKLSGAVA